MKLSQLFILTAGLCTIHASNDAMTVSQHRALLEKNEEEKPPVKENSPRTREVQQLGTVVTKTAKENEDEKIIQKAWEEQDSAGSPVREESGVVEEPRKRVDLTEKIGLALSKAPTNAGRQDITLPGLGKKPALNPITPEPQPTKLSAHFTRPMGQADRKLSTSAAKPKIPEKVPEPKEIAPPTLTEGVSVIAMEGDGSEVKSALAASIKSVESIASDPVVDPSPAHSTGVLDEKSASLVEELTQQATKTTEKTDDFTEQIEAPKIPSAANNVELVKPDAESGSAYEDDFERLAQDFVNGHELAEVTLQEDGTAFVVTSPAQELVAVPTETQQVDEQPEIEEEIVQEKASGPNFVRVATNDINGNSTLFDSDERTILCSNERVRMAREECRIDGKYAHYQQMVGLIHNGGPRIDATLVPKAELDPSEVPSASQSNQLVEGANNFSCSYAGSKQDVQDEPALQLNIDDVSFESFESTDHDPEPPMAPVRTVSEPIAPLHAPHSASKVVAPIEPITSMPIEIDTDASGKPVRTAKPFEIQADIQSPLPSLKGQTKILVGSPLIAQPGIQNLSRNGLNRGRSNTMLPTKVASVPNKVAPVPNKADQVSSKVALGPPPNPFIQEKSPKVPLASNVPVSSHESYCSCDSSYSESDVSGSGAEASVESELEDPSAPEEHDVVIGTSTTLPTSTLHALKTQARFIPRKRAYVLWILVGVSLFLAVVSPLTYYIFIFRPRLIAASILPDFPVKP